MKEMNKPLNFREIMDVDEKVLEVAEIIHKDNFRSFFTSKEPKNAHSIMLLTAYPLMIETEKYYNGELLSTYAVYKAMRDMNKSYRVTAYYFENLIFRIISFWEYLFQFLNMHFHLQLYDDSAIKKIIEISGYVPEFIPEGQGTRVEYVALPKEEQKKIRSKWRKSLKRINKNNIVNYIANIYEVNGNLEELLEIIVNNNVEIIKTIRNQIIHQRPAGASFTIKFDGMFKDYSVLINNNGWIEFNKYDIEIEKCMNYIGEAIQKVHEIVHLSEYPNRIENAGREYFVKSVQCNSCNDNYIAPSLLLGDKNEFADIIFCPLCGGYGGKVLKSIRTTEIDHDTRLGNYFSAFEELNEDNK
jgi:hypothetical protein